jgi:putative serine protease PepD
VYAVASDGPAAKAGLRPGDVLTAVGSQKLSSVEELFTALRQHEPGEHVSVAYLRDGQSRLAQVNVADRPT